MATSFTTEDRTRGGTGNRRLVVLLLLLVAAFVGVFYSNHYIARHQPVYVVNGLAAPVVIDIAGAVSMELPAAGWRVVSVPEGEHRAVVSGATNQTIDFAFRNTWWERWRDRQARIINVGGAAVLVEESTYYATQTEVESALASDQPRPEGELIFHYGQPFLTVSNVDYFFEDFPEQVDGDTRKGTIMRRRVDVSPLSPPNLVVALVRQTRFAQALDLAEWYLSKHPEAVDLLPTYLGTALRANEKPRARAFLEDGARHRPVRIQWHRMYQETRQEDTEALIEEYDRWLAAEPNHSAWLYLRGRLEETCERSASYYERAITADPSNAFAHFALGTVRASQQRWEDAKRALQAAVELRPEDEQFQDALFEVRMALGESEALIDELSARLRENPVSYSDNLRLADVYAARAMDQPLRDLLMQYATAMHTRFQRAGMEAVVHLDARVAYSIGHFSEIEELAQTLGESFPPMVLFEARIEQGAFARALDLFPLEDSTVEDPLHYLTVSLAFALAGRPEDTKAWKDRGLSLLLAGRPEYRAAARMLADESAPEPSRVLDLVLTPSAKAVVCAVLALQFPEIRAELLRATAAYNISRDYPFHLLNRFVEAYQK